jgi:septal ring factor EnvC (AmiA/AmiB activator)
MDNLDNSLEKEFSEYALIAHIVKAIDEEMVSPADIQHGIQAVTATLTTLQKAAEIAKRTKITEISEILTDLRGEIVETKNLLIDTKADLVALKEENLDLKERLKKAEQQKPEIELVQNKNGLYYKTDGEGPFCKYCSEKLGTYVSMGLLKIPDVRYRCGEDPYHISYPK